MDKKSSRAFRPLPLSDIRDMLDLADNLPTGSSLAASLREGAAVWLEIMNTEPGSAGATTAGTAAATEAAEAEGDNP